MINGVTLPEGIYDKRSYITRRCVRVFLTLGALCGYM